LKAAFEAVDFVHKALIIIAGMLVGGGAWLTGHALHLSETQLVVWPAAAFFVVLVFSFFFEGHYALYNEEHAQVLKLSPEPGKEAEVRDQVSPLSRAEVLVLKYLLRCGQLTQERANIFCEQNGLEPVDLPRLDTRVTFLNREGRAAAWFVVGPMEAAVRKVISEMDP
jgi:hypothetical protein